MASVKSKNTYKGLAKDSDPRYKRNAWRILFGKNINKDRRNCNG